MVDGLIRMDQLRDRARPDAYTGPFKLDYSFLDSAAYFDDDVNEALPPITERQNTGAFQLDFSRLDSGAFFKDGPPYPLIVED